jgi:hypothetical protein
MTPRQVENLKHPRHCRPTLLFALFGSFTDVAGEGSKARWLFATLRLPAPSCSWGAEPPSKVAGSDRARAPSPAVGEEEAPTDVSSATRVPLDRASAVEHSAFRSCVIGTCRLAAPGSSTIPPAALTCVVSAFTSDSTCACQHSRACAASAPKAWR